MKEKMSRKSKKGRSKKGRNKINKMAEIEDAPELLDKKCEQLATYLRKASCCMVYTGAGISTAASIPDYRGPNGLWTMAQKGMSHKSHMKSCNPIEADPTVSHMALRELYKRGMVQHVLSQNCDGFHLRSGLPQKSLSEVHGNMHIEVCSKCEPMRQYIRSFDVTKHTRFRRHKTERRCESCYGQLQDTIVHFGEIGKWDWPLNWSGVAEILDRNCDLIVCLGSSLKILQKYEFLWFLDRPVKDRPKLVVVNLQWTSKDKIAALKINGKCDNVMEKVMEKLHWDIPRYCRTCDPVLHQRRRNSRNGEMMTKIVECVCQFSVLAEQPGSNSHLLGLGPSNYKNTNGFLAQSSSLSFLNGAHRDLQSSTSNECIATFPGWWTAGLMACSKRKRSETSSETGEGSQGSGPLKRGRGRPRKVANGKRWKKVENLSVEDEDEEDNKPLSVLLKEHMTSRSMVCSELHISPSPITMDTMMEEIDQNTKLVLESLQGSCKTEEEPFPLTFTSESLESTTLRALQSVDMVPEKDLEHNSHTHSLLDSSVCIQHSSKQVIETVQKCRKSTDAIYSRKNPVLTDVCVSSSSRDTIASRTTNIQCERSHCIRWSHEIML